MLSLGQLRSILEGFGGFRLFRIIMAACVAPLHLVGELQQIRVHHVCFVLDAMRSIRIGPCAIESATFSA